MEGILPDRASINRPHGFNGKHYSFWKAKFKVFVMASEYGLWRAIDQCLAFVDYSGGLTK